MTSLTNKPIIVTYTANDNYPDLNTNYDYKQF